MYDELLNRLRDAAKMSEALAVLLPHSEGNATAKLFNEAADAIEELQQIAAHYEETAKDYFKDVCYYLERVPKWIPVTERLPSNGTNVLVFEFGRVEQAYTTTYTADRSLCWVVINGGSYHRISDADCPIKWWMPLPEPPKEEK